MDIKKQVKPKQNEHMKPCGNWKNSHVVFFFLPVILTMLFPLGGIFYLSGRFCTTATIFFYVYLLYLVVIIFIFYCFISGIMKLSDRRVKRTRTEKFLIATEIAIPFVFIGLLAVFIFLAFTNKEFLGPRFKFFMYGIRDRVKSQVDIEATRMWLQSLGDEDYNEKDLNYERLSKARWPESLKGLKHAVAYLSKDENSNIKVRMEWGSGMLGHWGVEIGMKDMKIPPSDLRQYGEYRLPLEPGVYVWHELQ